MKANKIKEENYYINTRKLFKIWFSNNPDIYLTNVNILRFIKFIFQNQNSQISFIYKKRLLSKSALEDLNKFCKDSNINPVSLEDIIENEPRNDAQEQKLNQIIHQELNFWISKEGGNPGSASDLVRIKKYVLEEYGIYSDFDVDVNLSQLKILHPIKVPVISDLCYDNNNIIGISNDFLAASIDKKTGKLTPDAKLDLNIIRDNIISKYQEFDNISNQTKMNPSELFQYIARFLNIDLKNIPESGERVFAMLFYAFRNYISKNNKEKKTIFQFREFIKTEINASFFIKTMLAENTIKKEKDENDLSYLKRVLINESPDQKNHPINPEQKVINVLAACIRDVYFATVLYLSGPPMYKSLITKNSFLEYNNLQSYVLGQDSTIKTTNDKEEEVIITKGADASWYDSDPKQDKARAIHLEKEKYFLVQDLDYLAKLIIELFERPTENGEKILFIYTYIPSEYFDSLPHLDSKRLVNNIPNSDPSQGSEIETQNIENIPALQSVNNLQSNAKNVDNIQDSNSANNLSLLGDKDRGNIPVLEDGNNLQSNYYCQVINHFTGRIISQALIPGISCLKDMINDNNYNYSCYDYYQNIFDKSEDLLIKSIISNAVFTFAYYQNSGLVNAMIFSKLTSDSVSSFMDGNLNVNFDLQDYSRKMLQYLAKTLSSFLIAANFEENTNIVNAIFINLTPSLLDLGASIAYQGFIIIDHVLNPDGEHVDFDGGWYF